MVKKAKEKSDATAKHLSDINKKHVMVLYNDDINSFDHVIGCLVDICQHDLTQAEQCAFITHYNGKCDIKNGTLSNLKPMKDMLIERGLNVNIQ